jgi:hypothetical protein
MWFGCRYPEQSVHLAFGFICVSLDQDMQRPACHRDDSVGFTLFECRGEGLLQGAKSGGSIALGLGYEGKCLAPIPRVRNVASPCERVIEAARQEPLNISAALNIFRSDDVRWHVSTTPNVFSTA